MESTSDCRILIVLIVTIFFVIKISGSPPKNCPNRCGDLSIPYPFGIGYDCSFSGGGFKLNCDSKKLFLGAVEVTEILLNSGQVYVLMDMSYQCYTTSGLDEDDSNRWSLDLNQSPFRFSYTENVFTAIGCDTWVLINGTRGKIYAGGCVSMCEDVGAISDGSCSGIGCCQTSIPQGFRRYDIEFKSSNNHSDVLDFNPCSFGFLVGKNNYTFRKDDLNNMDKTRKFPIVLDWAIGSKSCGEAKKSKKDYACVSENSECFDSNDGHGYLCRCSGGFVGNPYLADGCQDINECEDPKTYPCHEICINTPGGYSCSCPAGTTGNATTYGCVRIPSQLYKPVIVIPVAVGTSLIITSLIIFIHLQVQRRRATVLKMKFFHENGGHELQKKISRRDSLQQDDGFTMFTKEEMEKATNNFDSSSIIGIGSQTVVYRGKLHDRTLAVRRSLKVDKRKINDFIDEIAVLSQINHTNVVKLVGCCLEVAEPLLVYQFISNGTLEYHLKRSSIPWETRLKVGSEIAGAIGCLHSLTPTPVTHRNVKSSNILLDVHFTAKVADFGASGLIPEDKILMTAFVLGSLGYLDPEYLQTQRLTEKSDVYSFGVVLVELLTGLPPFSSSVEEGERSLAKKFTSYMICDMVAEIFDSQVKNPSVIDQMKKVAGLAMRCLSARGEDRPTMVEVAMELHGLRGGVSGSERHPWLFNEISEPDEGQSLLVERLRNISDDHDGNGPNGDNNDEDDLHQYGSRGKFMMIPMEVER